MQTKLERFFINYCRADWPCNKVFEADTCISATKVLMIDNKNAKFGRKHKLFTIEMSDFVLQF